MTPREKIAAALLEKLVHSTNVKLSETETEEDRLHNLKAVCDFMRQTEAVVQSICAGFVQNAAAQLHQIPTNTIKGGWFKEGGIRALTDASRRMGALEIEPQEETDDRAQSGQTLLKLD